MKSPVDGLLRTAMNVSIAVACGASLVFFVPLAAHGAFSASHSEDGVWAIADEEPLQSARPVRWIVPQKYTTFRLDATALRGILDRAPREFTSAAAASQVVLTIPMPDGTYARFSVLDSPIMEAPLAARFPEIRTYIGQGLDDPTASMRFDWTPNGFHAMVLSSGGTVFVDPYSRGDVEHYISYDKRDYKRAGPVPRCLVGDGTESKTTEDSPSAPPDVDAKEATLPPDGAPTAFLTPVGPTLRIYRAAVAADGEYTVFHGGTVPLGLAAVTTTMNRVNGVYERDLAVRMVLVANESSIIYTNPNTDPYTNTSPSTLLNQNQSNLDSVIGAANYDIGHVFTTGGGGLSALGVVCVNGSKARSETGSGTPIGDAYDIDYVAHEMGHQFGASHTFNGTTANCGGGNRSAASAYEPGSGTTIMAYAGICGIEDVQPHSDDYFHTRSFDSIVSFLGGTGGNCAVPQATGNLSPVIDAGPSFTIPANTPFTLTAAGASDGNGDPLTYCWEEFDLGTAAPPNTDDGTRPIFRSFNPTTSPSRTFPRLADVLSGSSTLGESLPTTNRTMTFRVTARDNRANGGGVDYDSMQVTSTTSAGPFVVTRPNTNLSWMGNSTQMVQWNVAGTSAAPVSAANVKVSLSADGGSTFPTVLLASTPNDGAQSVIIPDTPTSAARIKVEGVGNVFFDVSNMDFTILADTQSPFLNVEQIESGPEGTDGDTSVEPGEAAHLTVTLTNNGTAAATNVTGLLVSNSPDVTVVTSYPVDYPDLAPNDIAVGAIPYKFTVSSSAPCGAPIGFQFIASFAESGGPMVRTLSLPIGSPGGSTTYNYAGAAASIPDNVASGTDTTLTVSGFTGLTTDLNLGIDGTLCNTGTTSTTVGITHTWVGDLNIRLTSPLGTAVTLASRPGGVNNSGNNFCQTVLDDAGASNIQSIAAAGAPFVGTFSPLSPLSPFNGENPNGVWTLNVSDVAAQDTGTLRSWSLRIGGTTCSTTVPAPGVVPDGTFAPPLTVGKSGADLTLAWGTSCRTSGVDYAIYQGSLGTWYSHESKFCTTQGLLSKTFAADPGDLYFLVVPLTADNEGSYGMNSAQAEIPQGTGACRNQLLTGCP